ncbi:uncharacterized protein LOC117784120 [Drosophila innubila]|uniref:uncharacterized protein LOC117784120 n=1 Tax=Drosophila innubila TaxID=198719 RepID=UPI00148C4643|nr:uncharacterized protein LOC117784120 [Drosophila innubila]
MDRSTKNRARRVTIQWHPEAIHQLIEAVEESECLWNVADTDYKNRYAKEASWNSISEQLGVSNRDVVVKWNSLRNTYRTALKTSLTRSQSGSAKKPTFPYYELMSFLEPIMTIEDKGTLVPKIQNDSSDSDSRDPSTYRTIQSKDPIQEETLFETSSYSSRFAEESADIFNTANNMLSTNKNKRKYQPDVDAFGELIKAEMELVEDPKKRRAIRLKILQTIAEADN